MKTFKDLEFKQHRVFINGKQATIFFENGYGCSVITGYGAYGDYKKPYEIAILKGNRVRSELCYNTGITGDVIGYCTPEKITKVMKKIQKLEGVR